MRRASLSGERELIDDMVRLGGKPDATLGHVASWGDRRPIAVLRPLNLERPIVGLPDPAPPLSIYSACTARGFQPAIHQGEAQRFRRRTGFKERRSARTSRR
jgi:hypothetical protein